MTYETTFHIHKMDDDHWQIEYYRDTVLLETVLVDCQEDIGAACDNLYDKHKGDSDDGT